MQEYNMPDYTVRVIKSGVPGKNRKYRQPKYRQPTSDFKRKEIKEDKVSNLITNNPFVPVKTDYDYSQASRPRGNERGKFKFKLPKLKFSGSGKRTAMRGKIK